MKCQSLLFESFSHTRYIIIYIDEATICFFFGRHKWHTSKAYDEVGINHLDTRSMQELFLLLLHLVYFIPENWSMGISGSNWWRYCIIFEAIFSGDIPYIALYLYRPNIYGIGTFNFYRFLLHGQWTGLLMKCQGLFFCAKILSSCMLPSGNLT